MKGSQPSGVVALVSQTLPERECGFRRACDRNSVLGLRRPMIAEIFASAISVGAISARSEFTILEIQVLRMLVEVACRRSRLAVLSATMISLVLVMPERGDAMPQAKA